MELNKSDITLIKSLVTNEMKKLESSLNSSRKRTIIEEHKEDWAKHILQLDLKLNKLDSLLKKLSR